MQPSCCKVSKRLWDCKNVLSVYQCGCCCTHENICLHSLWVTVWHYMFNIYLFSYFSGTQQIKKSKKKEKNKTKHENTFPPTHFHTFLIGSKTQNSPVPALRQATQIQLRNTFEFVNEQNTSPITQSPPPHPSSASQKLIPQSDPPPTPSYLPKQKVKQNYNYIKEKENKNDIMNHIPNRSAPTTLR